MHDVDPPQTSLRGILARAVVLPLALMLILAAALVWQVRHLLDVNRWVDHADRVLTQIHLVEKLLLDLETGLRGFLMTPDARFLEPYRAAEPKLADALDDLDRMVANDPQQAGRTAELRARVDPWRTYAELLLAARRGGGDMPTLDDRLAGKQQMDEMRALLTSMIAAERDQRDARSAAAQRMGRLAAGTGAALTILLGAVVAFSTRRQLSIVSQRYDSALATANSREADLRASEERFRATFEHAPIGVAQFSADGRWILVNDELCRIVGYPREQLLERRFRDITHADDVAATDEFFRRALAGEIDYFSIEKRYIRGDGGIVWVNKSVALVRNPAGGALPYFIAAVEDITARKEAERAILEAKNAAEDANRAKDQFIAILSHELRTPLTPVLAIVSAMQDDPALPESYRGEIEMVRRNVELEAHLIDDLLDLTGIARGKLELRRETVDAHQLIDNAVRICGGELRARRLKLKLELFATHHHASADARRLQQVFWNLLQNAIKFTPPDGTVTIASHDVAPGDAGGQRVRIEVSDTGVGIEAAMLPRLFQPFEQGERTVTRRFGGLGLGLAISKALVEAHGGRIEATSPGAGLGSTFSIELDTVEAPLPQGTGATRPGAAGADQKRLRILLVEDHPDTLRTMARLLQSCGYHVSTAATVAEAVESIRT